MMAARFPGVVRRLAQLRAAGRSVLVMIAVGVALSVVACLLVARLESARTRAEFEWQATERSLTIERVLDAHVDLLHLVGALYAASSDVSRDDFNRFVQAATPHQAAVESIAWAPRVPAEMREAAERALAGDGATGVEFTEGGPDGHRVPAGLRNDYFPVLYVEPLEANRALVGFDMGSTPERRSVLVRASESRKVAVSQRIPLEMGAPGRAGVLVVMPVFDGAEVKDSRGPLRGFLVAVLSLAAVIDSSLKQLPWRGLEFAIFDDAEPRGRRLLHAYPESSWLRTVGGSEDVSARTDLYRTRRISLADRQWTVVLTPSAAYRAARTPWAPWLALGAGLVITGLVAAYTSAVRGRAAEVQRLVGDRTSDLSASNDRLVAAYQELERRLTESRSLLAIARVIGATPQFPEALRRICRELALLTGADTVAAFVLDQGRAALQPIAAYHVPEHMRAILATTPLTVNDLGFARPVLDGGRIVWTDDARVNPEFDHALSRLYPHQSALVVPMLLGEEISGVFYFVWWTDRWTFDDAELATLEAIGRQVGLLIRNARLVEEVENRKTQLEQIFASTSDGLLVLDLAGRVTALNRRGADLLGADPDGVSGRPFGDLVTALGPSVVWGMPTERPLTELVGHAPEEASGYLAVAATPPRIVRWRATPTRDMLRDVVGLTVSLQDVTLEREVDRMKTEFVSTVSHELRTPLTSIKGSLQLLTTDPALLLDDDQRELLDISVKNAERLIRLINDILDVSKIEAGRIQLDLALYRPETVIAAAVDGIQGFAGARDIKIERELADDLPTLRLDADRMVQVVTNLLSNAIKFSPAGSRVRVSARRDGPSVVIAVSDEGPGIAAEDLPRLFQKFQQLDGSNVRKVGGTGLGLAICRGLVEEHGGVIGVESELGHGAAFIVTLPVPEDA